MVLSENVLMFLVDLWLILHIRLQNVVAWTNLGALYLKKDNIEVCVCDQFSSYIFFLFLS